MPTNNNINYAPTAVNTGAAAPALIGPLDTGPAAVAPGPGLGITPTATRAPVIPQVELPVQTQLTPEGETGPNVGAGTQQRYITILFDGTVVTNNATSLNFTGNGVSVSNLGTAGANIVITAGGGNYSNSNVSAFLAAFGSNTVSTTGNVTAGYVLGNGSQLTGITAASSYANANVVANLAALGTNPVSTTGNVTAGYVLGNGSQLTGIAASYGNSNVVANLAALGSNPVSTTGTVTAGNVTGGNVLTGGLISATSTITSAANITGGNILTGGLISAAGNVAGNFFIGNGSQLTGIAASYGNANVVANLAALGTNPVSTTGNVNGGNLLTGGLISATSTVTGSSLLGSVVSVTGNVTGGNVLTAGLISATANITGGNVLTAGLVSATSTITSAANITGGNILTAGLISATSTITSAANITGGNVLTGGLVSATSTITSAANITGGNVLTGGLVSATANVTGGNVLTGGLISASGAITSAANITGANIFTSGIISGTGNIFGGNAIFTGNLSVAGNVTYITSNVVTINDLAINLANNAANISLINGGGIELGPQGTPYVTFLYNTSANTFTSNVGLSAVANITGGNVLTGGLISATSTITSAANVNGGNLNAAGLSLSGNVVSALVSAANITTTANIAGGYILGNGSQLTGIAASYGNADIVANLAALGTNPVSTTGNVTGGNVLTGGLISATSTITSAANITGGNILTGGLVSATSTITSAANITGGNVLTGGLISATGNVTGGNILGNGRALTGILFSNTSDATTASLTVDDFYLSASTALTVTNSGASAYLFDQYPGNNPTIYAVAGSTLAFRLAVTGHPFLIQSSGANYSTGLNHVTTSGTVATDSSAQGQVAGTLYWKIPGNAVGNYTYQCSIHGGMVGNIVVSSPTAGSLASLGVTGNITGGNILTGGLVSATGNITGGNLIGIYANGTSNISIPTISANILFSTAGNANVLVIANTGIVANVLAATTATPANGVGYIGLPVSSVTSTGTLTIADAGKLVYITTTGQTVTIPANGSVAFPIGTAITFIAGPSATTLSIAITTDTMYLASSGTTGTRTLAAYGMATAVKVAATTWFINGSGLT